jgi:DNA-binding GntR family transcriptional regulator
MILSEQEQSFQRTRGQVARLLLEHAVNGTDGNNRLTQRDMAEMLGTGWATVHRSLQSLYNEGIIRIERNRISVNKELVQNMDKTI